MMHGKDLDFVAQAWNIKRKRWWFFYEPDYFFKRRMTNIVKEKIR